MHEQILHFLNFDLTPIYKGGFCCPLYSHASVFRFRSKLELLGLSQWCTSARQTSLEFIYIRQPCKKNNFHFLSVESIYQYLKLTYACICRKIKKSIYAGTPNDMTSFAKLNECISDGLLFITQSSNKAKEKIMITTSRTTNVYPK